VYISLPSINHRRSIINLHNASLRPFGRLFGISLA
jgi:hypothetical protein